MKKLTIGILSHVDAGKTTICENILYQSGVIKKLGRVDKKDSYFDSKALERERGITIFSKQAVFTWKDLCITLLDTPGHVDFSAEMERTLEVLDYAVLLINGADGVKGHTKTLWKLLASYQISTFVFVNKMDQVTKDKKVLLKELKTKLSDACIDFTGETMQEEAAMIREDFLEEFLEKGEIDATNLSNAIANQEIFPIYFGSALKEEGIIEFLDGFAQYTNASCYDAASLKTSIENVDPSKQKFGAKVFKISRDEKGNRLTHVKVTSGRLHVKDKIFISNVEISKISTSFDETIRNEVTRNEATNNEINIEEKVNEIRVYSGEKYEMKQEAEPGDVVVLTGLYATQSGMGLGVEHGSNIPLLQPVMRYEILLEDDIDKKQFMKNLYQLQEEDPQLAFAWDGQFEAITVQIMGEIQLEILKSLILKRYHVTVNFSDGKILYKETITNTVEGVGHFEPLRHYAEAHILLKPAKRGSGISYRIACSEDALAKNWQNLIMTHLKEKEHLGVLTNSPLTDVELILIGGRAHVKHTEGGDFREATYRALRQGLMQAHSILLEPYYAYSLELPTELLGRAISDLMQRKATHTITSSDEYMSTITGEAPVATMQNYQSILQTYAKGAGSLTCIPDGYRACHNEQEVIEAYAYDSIHDTNHPSGSIFCAHGAGFFVPWDEVTAHMHVKDIPKKEFF